jgi:hypothetical protein
MEQNQEKDCPTSRHAFLKPCESWAAWASGDWRLAIRLWWETRPWKGALKAWWSQITGGGQHG